MSTTSTGKSKIGEDEIELQCAKEEFELLQKLRQ